MSDAVVVKLGGTTIAAEQDTLSEIADLRAHRSVVVVHGGGKRLTTWLERLGVESHFDAGLRVTDDAALEVALGVLGGVVNGELVAALRGLGAEAVGVRGIDGATLTGERRPGLGRVVAEPRTDASFLSLLLDAGNLPVVAPLGLDTDGVICNVNADDAAAAISSALGGQLVLMTDTDGVLGSDGERIAELDAAEARRLIDTGVIAGGMVPKVRCALRALETGQAVDRVMIVDGRGDRPLRRALHEQSGTTVRLDRNRTS
jgi:acetylglutamate kinase